MHVALSTKIKRRQILHSLEISRCMKPAGHCSVNTDVFNQCIAQLTSRGNTTGNVLCQRTIEIYSTSPRSTLWLLKIPSHGPTPPVTHRSEIGYAPIWVNLFQINGSLWFQNKPKRSLSLPAMTSTERVVNHLPLCFSCHTNPDGFIHVITIQCFEAMYESLFIASVMHTINGYLVAKVQKKCDKFMSYLTFLLAAF